jgi:hypothetical protein
MKNVIDFILENWKEGIGLSVFILELVVRFTPTGKDYSIVNKMVGVLDVILPNLERDPATGKVRFKKRRLLRMISIFFVLSAFLNNTADAQANINARALFSYNVSDTAFVQSTRNTLQSSQGNTGAVYFDELRNKWRVWDGSQYVDLIRPAVALGITDAANGLWNDGGIAKLGINPISDNTDLLIEPGITLTHDIGTDGVGGFGRYLVSTGITGDQWLDIDPSNNSYQINAGGLGLNIESDVEAFLSAPDIDINGSTAVALRSVGGITSHNKHTFTPTASTAPVNLGLQATDPSGIVNGDMWINSTTFNALKVRMNNTTEFLLRNSAPGGTGEVLWMNSGNVGRTASNSAFTFTTATNTLTIPRVVTSTTATLPAFNLGGFAGTPSTVIDNDFWFNSTSSNISYRQAGTTRAFMMAPLTQVINAIPYSPGNSGAVHAYESEFTYNSTSNTLDVDIITLQPSATTPGLNVGTIAGDPSAPANGGIWYDSTANELTARINGVNVSLGSGSATLTSTHVGYGSAGNSLTGEAAFNYSAALDLLNVPNITATGSIAATTTATNPAYRITGAAANPSSNAEGDFWYNTTLDSYGMYKASAITYAVTNANTFSTNHIPYALGGSTTLGSEAGFTYDPGTDVFTSSLITMNAGAISRTTNTTDLTLSAVNGGNIVIFQENGGADTDMSFTESGMNLGTTGGSITGPTTSDLILISANNALDLQVEQIKVDVDPTNPIFGVVTLVGGGGTVNTNKVTANSVILLTCQTPGGTPGFLRVSGRTPGTSFTIQSSNGLDTSTVGYWILEPN